MYCWCNTTNESAAYPSTILKCGAKKKETRNSIQYMKHLHILKKWKPKHIDFDTIFECQFPISHLPMHFRSIHESKPYPLFQFINQFIQSINFLHWQMIKNHLRKKNCEKLITRFKQYVITRKWGLTQKPISIIKATTRIQTHWIRSCTFSGRGKIKKKCQN